MSSFRSSPGAPRRSPGGEVPPGMEQLSLSSISGGGGSPGGVDYRGEGMSGRLDSLDISPISRGGRSVSPERMRMQSTGSYRGNSSGLLGPDEMSGDMASLHISPIGNRAGGISTSGYYGSSPNRVRRPADVSNYSPEDVAMCTPHRFRFGSPGGPSGYDMGQDSATRGNVFPVDPDLSGISPMYPPPNIQLEDYDLDDDYPGQERGAIGGQVSPISSSSYGNNRLQVPGGLGVDDEGSTDWSDVIQERSTDLDQNQLDWFDFVDSLRGQVIPTPSGALSPERDMPKGYILDSPDAETREDPEKLAEWQREFRAIKKYEEGRNLRRGVHKQQFTFVGDNASTYMTNKVDDYTHQPPKVTIGTLLAQGKLPKNVSPIKYSRQPTRSTRPIRRPGALDLRKATRHGKYAGGHKRLYKIDPYEWRPKEQREREEAEERAFAEKSRLRKEKRLRKKQRDAIRMGLLDPVSDVTSSEEGEEIFGQEEWDSSELEDNLGY